MNQASVDLYWLPLGAGDNTNVVRTNGRIFEALSARVQRRERRDLYHAALEVRSGVDRFVIEMTPVWADHTYDRGVVCEGPVGLRCLGRFRLFRYEVRCWRDGVILDRGEAVDSPVRVSADPRRAGRLLSLVPQFPAATWGRDELDAGDMWNSNSLVAWLLTLSDHAVGEICPPTRGRAPGWAAGCVVAERQRQKTGALPFAVAVTPPGVGAPGARARGPATEGRSSRSGVRGSLKAARWVAVTPADAHQDVGGHLSAPHHVA